MPPVQGRVLLAEPRGSCASVLRAVEIVERALEKHGAPVYVRKRIVHDEDTVRQLEARGARFVDSETEIPDGAVCARDERTLILVGHADHEEIEGTYGEAPDRTVIVRNADEARRLDLAPGTSAACLTLRATLSVDDTAEILSILRERFPGLAGPGDEDIRCGGQNRENAVKAMAGRSDLVLVVGSADSTNAARMVDVARAAGARARLLPDADQLDPEWLTDVRTVGLSAGASVPDVLVEQVIERLGTLGLTDIETEVCADENVVFRPPPTLERSARGGTGDGASGDASGDDACAKLLARAGARIEDLLSAECSRWGAVDARAAVPVEAIAELVAAGGKQLRPTFCISGYLAADGTTAGTASEDAVVAAAAGLELLHVFALIHDDILDNSPTRRGVPTVHAKYAGIHAERGWTGEPRRYGEGVAILAGDLAFSYANKLTSGLPGPAMEIWTDLGTEMLIGQHLDMALAAAPAPDPDLARWIAVCKSGRYTIHRPLALGASIAGRPDLHTAFEAYGVSAGEAFQLRDDLLDAFGDSAATGKPAGLDVSEHKMNLVLALAATRDGRVARLVADGQNGGDWDPAGLRAALLASDVRQEIEQRIDQLVTTARTALEAAPLADDWQQRLGEMAARVAYRDR
ncbi:polyprenyl synthetase family protein [Streptomyces sp. NPDC052236]|uniref:polyprenyl synthetase family protein n=1 Tax=Streptomyces sp. NPDC052236 TaxID=3365686 RepID=UPI0037CFAA57